MRMNLPVSQREYDYPSDRMLVSMTDTKGVITHCNHAFVETSGFSYEELIGQNHNLVRHPDMPPAAYRDMWHTIGNGKPWTALVKNRRKDGDHYWVQANVTPILENGKPKGYMSVRIKPGRQEIQAAEALYAQMRAEEKAGKTSVYLRGGEVRYRGLRGWAAAPGRLSLSARLGLALLAWVLLGMLPQLTGLEGSTLLWAQLLTLAGGALGVWTWFQLRFTAATAAAEQFAYDLAGCNLRSSVTGNYPPPLGNIVGALRQIQINLRAVVGDVREEIDTLTRSAAEIASGSMDLSARTEAQASSLEETAASMEELSSTVRQTADTAGRVAEQSERSSRVASEGGVAVHQVIAAMDRIEHSSGKMRDIISAIEGIAFQTNILALNAAVEAARAGEQGRGFAVVASEVRALAQRSATAAREIRELIAQSSEQISEGSGQMKSAGGTIDSLVAHVREVGNLIQMITSATKEQSVGISQVNEAVTQLDTVTQQNAALVEESAASASDLHNSTVSVARAVQVFQLP
nr:methyl-accepting chemotaxis protein [uncultured Rhodoferax sp.]